MTTYDIMDLLRRMDSAEEEVERLRAINAKLLEACEESLLFEFRCGFNSLNQNKTKNKIRAAIANAQQGE